MFCSNKGGQEKYALTSSPKSQSSSWQNGNGSIHLENVAIFSQKSFFHAHVHENKQKSIPTWSLDDPFDRRLVFSLWMTIAAPLLPLFYTIIIKSRTFYGWDFPNKAQLIRKREKTIKTYLKERKWNKKYEHEGFILWRSTFFVHSVLCSGEKSGWNRQKWGDETQEESFLLLLK